MYMCCANNCTHGRRYHPLAPLQHSLAPPSGVQHTSAGWPRCAQQTRVLLAVPPPSCRQGTRQEMLPCLLQSKGWVVPTFLPQGQAEYCAKFYIRQTFESIQARLAKLYSASLSPVQYFHNGIKASVLVTGLKILASFDFNMKQLQFSRKALYQLGGTMLNSLLKF